MSARVFFNRPYDPWDRAELLEDMEQAQSFLCVASGWLSDERVIGRILTSDARITLAILNRADIQREHAFPIYERLSAWANAAPAPFERVVIVLGGTEWEAGIMHHKFVVCDDRVTWLGSMNLTSTSDRNYETMVRLPGVDVATQFANEALGLLGEVVPQEEMHRFTPRWMYGKPTEPTRLADVFAEIASRPRPEGSA